MDTGSSNLYKLWIRSARQIVQVVENGARILKEKDMQKVAVIQERSVDGKPDGVGVIVGKDGRIKDIGFDSELGNRYVESDFDQVLNATGHCVLPGLVDAHTHPVWAGDRVHEFSMKLAGASYMDIHKAGGGIYFTVDHTRTASEDDLYASLTERLKLMLQNGTTLAETKSGYGLDLESEIKLLRVLNRSKNDGFIDMSITYCGAHAVPKDLTSEVATDQIVDDHLPSLKRQMEAGQLHIDNVDVFCEKNVFTVAQTRRILEKSKSLGMQANFHAEELSYQGGAEMGSDLGASGISHLEYISDEGIDKMAEAESVAVLLPTTAFLMRLTPPPVRKMIERGVAVALGTDFNPNAYCLSMPMVMHLAAVLFHMSLPETLVAATINGAASLNLADSHGSIEKGKFGDFVLIKAPTWEHLVYQFGNTTLISAVIRKGIMWNFKPVTFGSVLLGSFTTFHVILQNSKPAKSHIRLS